MKEWIKKMEYTMEYYSAIKKNANLPLATTSMKLEGIMLSEISGKTCSLIKKRDWWFPGGRQEVGKMDEGSQKVKTSNYKINKS